MLQATVGDEPAQLRDRALLFFLADTGCRVGGLVGLRLSALDLAPANRVGDRKRRQAAAGVLH